MYTHTFVRTYVGIWYYHRLMEIWLITKSWVQVRYVEKTTYIIVELEKELNDTHKKIIARKFDHVEPGSPKIPFAATCYIRGHMLHSQPQVTLRFMDRFSFGATKKCTERICRKIELFLKLFFKKPILSYWYL